jgi:hypothetical protein
MIQLVGLIATFSSTLFNTYQPRFAFLRLQQNDNKHLISLFSYSLNVFYFLFILGGSTLVIAGPWLLALIKSNATLPATSILILYLIVIFLENNHSFFATLIVTKNSIPFVFPSLFAGVLIAIGSLFSLSFTQLGIMGLVLVQGFSQLIYNNWKWPNVICKEFNISFSTYYSGIIETKIKLKSILNGRL